MPGIGDPRFAHSVIAMCAHDGEGAFGLCLQKTVDDIRVPDLMRQMGIDPGATPRRPVMAGGPVEPGRGFVLHSPDWSGQDTRYVAGRWALTGTRDVLAAIARDKGPSRWMMALGYAGWASQQLEDELGCHGWFSTLGTDAILWDTPPDLRWKRAFATAGINTAMLVADAGNA